MKALLFLQVFSLLTGAVQAGPFSFSRENSRSKYEDNQDRQKEGIRLARDNGFDYEEHFVHTDDGYILKIVRIPGTGTSADVSQSPILWWPGISDSSDSILTHESDKAPSFSLARAGYDLWIGNNRGNKYCLRHEYLDGSMESFWDFSFEEHANYDLPAVIDYILAVTGAPKLAYVGHSQGTTNMLMALAENEEHYVDKVSLFVVLGGTAVLNGTTAKTWKWFSNHHKLFYNYLDSKTAYGIVFLEQKFFKKFVEGLCTFSNFLCRIIVQMPDEKPSKDQQNRFEVFFNHYPGGTSAKSLMHLIQLASGGGFKKFDYGTEENLERYGQSTPPDIDLTQIDEVPVALFAGTLDKFTTVGDVQFIRENVQSLVFYEEIEVGHLGFLLSKDMSYFQDLLGLLEQYHPVVHN